MCLRPWQMQELYPCAPLLQLYMWSDSAMGGRRSIGVAFCCLALDLLGGACGCTQMMPSSVSGQQGLWCTKNLQVTESFWPLLHMSDPLVDPSMNAGFQQTFKVLPFLLYPVYADMAHLSSVSH